MTTSITPSEPNGPPASPRRGKRASTVSSKLAACCLRLKPTPRCRNLIVAPVREHSRKPDAGAAGATRLIDPRKLG
jgi:hypothetical protein